MAWGSVFGRDGSQPDDATIRLVAIRDARRCTKIHLNDANIRRSIPVHHAGTSGAVLAVSGAGSGALATQTV